jgi:signal transduction histidine kinase
VKKNSEFTREDSGYSRRFDGNGLGLALSKKYAELNDAAIAVESTKGVGSTFTVKFGKNGFKNAASILPEYLQVI